MLAHLEVARGVGAADVLAQQGAVVLRVDLEVEDQALQHGVAVLHGDAGFQHGAAVEQHGRYAQRVTGHGRHVLLDVNVADAAGWLRAVVVVRADRLQQADLLAVEHNDDPVAGTGFQVGFHGDCPWRGDCVEPR
ncbi:hypothetical protein D3C81_1752080 [compost metagenome]